MQATQQNSLNQLTAELTAFRTFADLADAMDRGYTPTLQAAPARKNQRRVIERNQKVAELADRLEALGWKVWRGTNPKG
jgi:hypothetical protein